MVSNSPRGGRGYLRWYVLLFLSPRYLITYTDRVNISTTAPLTGKEFEFDKITMGIIFSAFTWAYALFRVPGEWLGDRFGPRGVLGTIVTYWSVMTALTARAFNVGSFTVVEGGSKIREYKPGDQVMAFNWCNTFADPYKVPALAPAQGWTRHRGERIRRAASNSKFMPENSLRIHRCSSESLGRRHPRDRSGGVSIARD